MKLPFKTQSVTYELEYGTDELQIHEDAIRPGQKILLVDDLIATGGTAKAACELVDKLGGELLGLTVLIELVELKGRDLLAGTTVQSLIQY